MIPGLFVSTWLRRAEFAPSSEGNRAVHVARAEGELAGGQQGLVHAAYLHTPTLHVAPGARFRDVKYPHRAEPPEGGKRGKIVGRSMASCRNFRKLMACLLVGATPVEFTLTYPKEFPADPKRWKLDLRSLLVAVQRKWSRASGIWVLEKQEKRAAPHYHVVVFLEAHVPAVRGLATANRQEVNRVLRPIRQWLGKTWHRIAGRGHANHLRVGTGVRRVRSKVGVASYLAGYLAKQSQTWTDEGVGRYWGVFNKRDLPRAEVVAVELTHEAAIIAARTLRKERQSKRRAQRNAARGRGARIRKRVKHRAGSFWTEGDVDTFLARLPLLVEAKAKWKQEQKAAWGEAGWPTAPGGKGQGMRQHPGPRGLSACTVQPERRLSSMTPTVLYPLHTPAKGVGSIGASDASGGPLWYGGCQTTGVIRRRVGVDSEGDCWKEYGQGDREALRESRIPAGVCR